MIKYSFQTRLQTDDIRQKINKKVNRYFSEIMELKEIKKYKPLEQRFLILLGGKNVGKSYWAINQLLDVVKNGGRACYMRNSLNEIKAMKPKLAEMIKKELGVDIKATDQGIFNWERTKTYISFVEAKNYNKFSGNLEGYDILVYDEFNQDLAGNGNDVVVRDLPNLLNTIFRNKEIKVIACGNTKTKNNVFFNAFQVSVGNMSSPIEVIKKRDYKVLFIQYLDTAFKQLNGDNESYKILKFMDQLNYNTMFSGASFERDDEQVINKFDLIKNEFDFTNQIILHKNRIYGIFKWRENDKVWFIATMTNDNITLDKLETLHRQKCKMYYIDNEDYANEHYGLKSFYLTNLVDKCISKLKNYQLFFDNYILYNIVRSVSANAKKLMNSLTNF